LQKDKHGNIVPVSGAGLDNGDSDFQDYYKWVTDGKEEDISKESEDVLFHKVPNAPAAPPPVAS
jgi:hypothetical protein